MSAREATSNAGGSASDVASQPALAPTSKPAIGRGFRLQWEPAQSGHVLLYPEGMVKLNGSAGEILKRCDGTRSITAIIEDLQQAFNAPDLSRDVTSFMSFALTHKWIELRE